MTQPIQVAIRQFREFAMETGGAFTSAEAVRAGIWSSNRSTTLGLKFNQLKRLAGLAICTTGPKPPDGSSPRHTPKPKVGAGSKPCLGYSDFGEGCPRLVPKGKFFCLQCKLKKDSLGTFGEIT